MPEKRGTRMLHQRINPLKTCGLAETALISNAMNELKRNKGSVRISQKKICHE